MKSSWIVSVFLFIAVSFHPALRPSTEVRRTAAGPCSLMVNRFSCSEAKSTTQAHGPPNFPLYGKHLRRCLRIPTRHRFIWEQIEPQPGRFDWSNVDLFVKGA